MIILTGTICIAVGVFLVTGVGEGTGGINDFMAGTLIILLGVLLTIMGLIQ
jgi:hypothetical protein